MNSALKFLRRMLFVHPKDLEDAETQARCAKCRVDESFQRNHAAYHDSQRNRVRVKELVDELLQRVSDGA